MNWYRDNWVMSISENLLGPKSMMSMTTYSDWKNVMLIHSFPTEQAQLCLQSSRHSSESEKSL